MTVPSAWVTVALALAVYRVVRLWLRDSIAQPLRERVWWLLVEGPSGGSKLRLWLADLLSCHWCLGIHVSLWATVAWCWWTGWPSKPVDVVPFTVTWLAVAALQSLLHALEPDVTE